ncbi:DNA-formamidopyrimidine glycosylase [Microcoleus sp. FACHB-672]|uniref:DNA-formamidopyrimidine glycosylase n=1 Tax=Microcoleus sp. FACHB-672 TaxID=2692825 RepID=UPI0016877A99|nr:DNA-formamidopyrimidine glycosylase [Microcoleus sp. FACHB-672]MBD2042729.1 DNA-formamidopyrimidine glycosylase [Microcoleus sp. FACHB-672]
MPELPEVETVRQGLNQLTLGQEILGGDVLLARTIAHPLFVEDFLTGLKGKTLAQWHRRGKYLLAELDDLQGTRGKGQGARGIEQSPSSSLKLSTQHSGLSAQGTGWLGVHLRMTGQLLWLDQDTPLQKHTRVRLFFAGNRELRFVDQRTFGQMWWVPPLSNPQEIITGLKLLGAEPFSAEFDLEYFVSKLARRQRPIKTALLDQSIVAGVGNIYADEALFKAGIRPETLCANLSRQQIERLHDAVIQVLQASIAAGGTTFSNFLNVQGINGNYAGVAWVYNRAGQPCRVCSTPLERLKLAGRSSHFCPQCQE